MLYKMRCPVCGAHFSKLDIRTQIGTVNSGRGEKTLEVVIGLCRECNAVLGVGGLPEKRRTRHAA